MNAPCKNCPDRRPHCHSCCDKYIEYVKFREDVRKRKRLEYDADAIAIETVLRIRKFRFNRRRK